MRHCTFGRGNLTMSETTIRRSLSLSLIQEGGGELAQLGRSAGFGPGDLVIYDSGATFDYALRAKTQPLKIPRRLLESKLDRPRDFLALKIDRSNPLSTILAEMLTRCLDIDLSLDLGLRIAKRLSNAIVGLVASICDLERDTNPAVQVSRPLERIMRFARANLDDPDLGPEALAAAGPMSVRSLNRLFGALGAAPMRWYGRNGSRRAESLSCRARFAPSRTRLSRTVSAKGEAYLRYGPRLRSDKNRAGPRSHKYHRGLAGQFGSTSVQVKGGELFGDFMQYGDRRFAALRGRQSFQPERSRRCRQATQRSARLHGPHFQEAAKAQGRSASGTDPRQNHRCACEALG
jgi:AraC-like protein